LSNLIGRVGEVSQGVYSNLSSEKKDQLLNLDAIFNLEVTFFEALNGVKKNLLVNDERIEIEIPKGIQIGKKYLLEIKLIFR
tara:strand:+ start:312 stop:557 length:246 start_codon:yes stop_codon:yes gene_type:complete